MLRKEVEVAVVHRLTQDTDLNDPDSLASVVGPNAYTDMSFLTKYNPDLERTDVFPRLTYFSKGVDSFQDKRVDELHVLVDDNDQDRFEAVGKRVDFLLTAAYSARPPLLPDGSTLSRLKAVNARIGTIKLSGEEDASDPKNRVFRKNLVFEISYAVS